MLKIIRVLAEDIDKKNYSGHYIINTNTIAVRQYFSQISNIPLIEIKDKDQIIKIKSIDVNRLINVLNNDKIKTINILNNKIIV